LLSGVVEIMLCLSQDLKTVCVSCFAVCRCDEGWEGAPRSGEKGGLWQDFTLSVGCAATVSLRLGHIRALTPRCGVIHYPHAALLPKGPGFKSKPFEMLLILTYLVCAFFRRSFFDRMSRLAVWQGGSFVYKKLDPIDKIIT